MQDRVLAVARSLAEAPEGAAIRLDDELDRIIGHMWSAAVRGDVPAFKKASRRYARHVLEAFDPDDGRDEQ